MRVTARISPILRDYADCILVRPTMAQKSQAKMQRAGTVLLTNVTVAANIRGDVMESSESRIKPKQTILTWPKMRYVASEGGYVDTRTGERIEKARAVYMYGTQIHYLP